MKTLIPNNTIVAGVAAFNARRWDDAFLCFQNHWLVVRSDECKALAQYANALNQLKLGLTSAPRTMLTRVLALTSNGSTQTGVDIQRMRVDVQLILAAIPAEGVPVVLFEIPPVQLEWCV